MDIVVEMAHTIKNFGTDESPQQGAHTVPLSYATEWYWFIPVHRCRPSITSGNMVEGLLKGREKYHRNRLRETKAHKGKYSDAVGNAVVTAFCVIHSKGKRPTSLTAAVTQKLLVEASINGFMMFTAAVLIWGYQASRLRMREDEASNVFVTNLEFGRH